MGKFKNLAEVIELSDWQRKKPQEDLESSEQERKRPELLGLSTSYLLESCLRGSIIVGF